ncbi:MAG: FliM/FliN family flagellar motor switch protein [Acidocella sp.]|nr:FliM/FliN family flagellar motor switch protein [Acidocella sp.]
MTDLPALDLLASGRTPQRRSALMEAQSDVIMRKIGFMLFQKMRCNVRLLSCINGVISHEAALASLPDIMLAGIAEMAPLHGRVIVAIEGDLIGAVVDGMCGATSSDMFYRTELSAMETRVAKQMVELTYTAIAEVFANLMTLKWTVAQYETTTSMLTIAAEQDWMISTTGIFETPIGIGSIRFIAPYAGFEPLETKVSSQLGIAGSSAADQRWMLGLAPLIDKVPFEIRLEIVRSDVPLGVFYALERGHVLPCFILPEAIAVSGGIDLFTADYGQHEGFMCCTPRFSNVAEKSRRSHSLAFCPARDMVVDERAALISHAAPLVETTSADRVTVRLTVELGSTSLSFIRLAELQAGALLVLDQLVGESLRIFANGYHVGTGEVVMQSGDKCGIRLVSISADPQMHRSVSVM